MVGLLPTPSVRGVVGYFLVAVGIVVAKGALTPVFDNLESAMRKQA
jgi:uncharacterized membrane protein YidH (DUF202 family)